MIWKWSGDIVCSLRLSVQCPGERRSLYYSAKKAGPISTDQPGFHSLNPFLIRFRVFLKVIQYRLPACLLEIDRVGIFRIKCFDHFRGIAILFE